MNEENRGKKQFNIWKDKVGVAEKKEKFILLKALGDIVSENKIEIKK